MKTNIESENFRNYLINKGGLTLPEFDQLTSTLQSKKVSKGHMFLREGEVCQHSFFVENGLLRSFTVDESGKEHIIQFAPENWFVSDRSSIFFNEPSDLFIEAIEDSTVVFINKDFMIKASELSTAFREYNERLLQNNIRHLQKRVNQLLSASAENRYLNFIQLYPDLLLKVPQWMIASYLGITPESLSRVRKDIATKNFKQ